MNELHDLFKMLAALIFVVALMGGLALALKRLGLAGPVMPKSKDNRLKIIDSILLDPRRRLVLVQRDDVQHLVILGANSETVIETGIAQKDAV